MNPRTPILYSFRRCPYAMRARMALHAAGTECELREVVLRDKPAEMLEASPKGTVPVLVLVDGRVLDESLAIMDWALAQADPEGWTQAPADRVRRWTSEIDGPFKHHLDRYKYSNRYGGLDPEPHRAAAQEILQRADAAIAEHGHLVGVCESLADIAAFPFVRQFANTDRDWFDGLDLPALHPWLARHLSSARFAAIMEKHAQWTGGAGPLVFSSQTRHTPPLSRAAGAPGGANGV
ncbi:MAG: glutathione S-transferase [Pseudomonadota bacterium]